MGFDGAELREKKRTSSGEAPSKSLFPPWTIVALSLIAGMIVYIEIINPITTTPTTKPVIKKKTETAKERALKHISTDFTWNTSASGNILEIDLHITNNSRYEVKDLSVLCSCAGASGTIISTPTKTLYEVIPQNTKMYFGTVNMGFIDSQTQKVDCDVYTLKVN